MRVPSCQSVAAVVVDLARKSVAFAVRPVPKRGALAIVTNVGTGCGGRSSVVTCFFAWTNDAIADGEVVWS
jgi:hypothetical protein